MAFAPSFGKKEIEKIYREDIARLLTGLDAISVRESSGVDIVKNLTGRHAVWLPDPTILFEDYENIAIRPVEAGYVFAYCLRGGYPIEHVKKVTAKHLDLPIIRPVNPDMRWHSRGRAVPIGPSRWLGHIMNARIVITNSFHGVIVSVLFKKDFLAVSVSGWKSNSKDDRITSFLARVGLADRFVTHTTPDADVIRLLGQPIDWEAVHEQLRAWRAEAWDYLRKEMVAPDELSTPETISTNNGPGQ